MAELKPESAAGGLAPKELEFTVFTVRSRVVSDRAGPQTAIIALPALIALAAKDAVSVPRGVIIRVGSVNIVGSVTTFTGSSVHGKQNLLEVDANSCGTGCMPRLDGLEYVLVTGINATTGAATKLATGTESSVKETTPADYNSYECGRRGKCDYDTGICSCFEGYTGEACTTLTALI